MHFVLAGPIPMNEQQAVPNIWGQSKNSLPDTIETRMVYSFGNDRHGSNQLETRVTDANGIRKALNLPQFNGHY